MKRWLSEIRSDLDRDRLHCRLEPLKLTMVGAKIHLPWHARSHAPEYSCAEADRQKAGDREHDHDHDLRKHQRRLPPKTPDQGRPSLRASPDIGYA